MNGILQDVRFAFRHLWQRPLWSGMIIAVLALGIGANTAMFSGYDAWVLRPLDFRAPEQLVAVRESQPALGRSAGVSPRNLGDWMEQQQSFEEVGAFSRERFNLSDESAPVRLDGTRVSASLFPMLGKRPVRGRGFRPEEDRPGQPAAVAAGLVSVVGAAVRRRPAGCRPHRPTRRSDTRDCRRHGAGVPVSRVGRRLDTDGPRCRCR